MQQRASERESRLQFAIRKRGRAVEGTGLENRQRETVRGFESHRFRHRSLWLRDRRHGLFRNLRRPLPFRIRATFENVRVTATSLF